MGDKHCRGNFALLNNSTNWSIPDYPTDFRLPLKINSELIYVTNSCTQTQAADWALLELSQSVCSVPHVNLEDIKQERDQVNHDDEDGERPANREHSTVRLDKGTLTLDLPGTFTDAEAIEQLKELFPKAQESQLTDVLNTCHGDVQWAETLLNQFCDGHFESDFASVEEESREPSPTSNSVDSHSFTLKLPLELVEQLEKEFGPVDRNIAELPIKLSREEAHMLWKKYAEYDDSGFSSGESQHHSPTIDGLVTLMKNSKVAHNKLSQEAHDLELAIRLSEEEQAVSQRNRSNLRTKTNTNNSNHLSDFELAKKLQEEEQALASNSMRRGKSNTVSNAHPRSVIDDHQQMELALQKSREDKPTNKEQNLYSTKMKREQLFRIYPGVAEEVLERTFAKNDYKLAFTLAELEDKYGSSGLLSLQEKLWLSETASGKDVDYPTPLPVKTPTRCSRRSIKVVRDEMLEVEKEKNETLQKANCCFQAKQYAVADYYRVEATKCDKKLKDLSDEMITAMSFSPDYKSNRVDLHGFRVQEARLVLKAFLDQKQEELMRSPQRKMFLEIVTGYGSHGTAPKIKPTVLQYLNAKKYRNEEINAGCLRVTLTQYN